MSEITINNIDSMLDDFRDSMEEFINSCSDEDRCELIVDTAQRKISALILEMEHEMELLNILETES